MRRSERLATLSKLLADQPNRTISLTEYAASFGVAKSTISEDLAILRDLFEAQGLGRIETMTGAAGGVRYVPVVPGPMTQSVAHEICRELSDSRRILPGGFLYMSDLVSSPSLMSRVGNVFATRFVDNEPEIVVTLETRGIPIALMTARSLNVPLAIVRRVSRVTEGSVVSMNYVSGSAKRIETMSLSRRALKEGMRVLIVDDFMKAGGTAKGLADLVVEFGAHVCGIGVLVETALPREKLVSDYISLVVLESVDEKDREIRLRPSSWVMNE